MKSKGYRQKLFDALRNNGGWMTSPQLAKASGVPAARCSRYLMTDPRVDHRVFHYTHWQWKWKGIVE